MMARYVDVCNKFNKHDLARVGAARADAVRCGATRRRNAHYRVTNERPRGADTLNHDHRMMLKPTFIYYLLLNVHKAKLNSCDILNQMRLSSNYLLPIGTGSRLERAFDLKMY